MDLNVDLGESFGRWKLGDDAAVIPWVTSANVACGYHAGDPATMRAAVRLALAHGVAVGAHVGLPDLLGFGRRQLAVEPGEVRDYATYQIGALAALAGAEGGRLSHVKPHGALYALCSRDPEHAGALAAAVADVDAGLPLLLQSRTVEPVVAAAGVPFVLEAFADLEYTPSGEIIIEATKRAWDPARVARRAVRLACEKRVRARGAGDVEVDARTICIHGDAPNAAEVARTVRRTLEAAGVTVAAL